MVAKNQSLKQRMLDKKHLKEKRVMKGIKNAFQDRKVQDIMQNADQTWEEMMGIYEECARAIADVTSEFNKATSMIRQLKLTPTPEVLIHLNGFSNTIEKLCDELLTVKKRHEGLTGVIPIDDISLGVSILEDYSVFKERIPSLLMPIMLTLTEFISDGVHAMKQQKKLEDLQNPGVISDVEVKMVN